MGEVGRPLLDLAKEVARLRRTALMLTKQKCRLSGRVPCQKMLTSCTFVCHVVTKEFVRIVKDYIDRFQPSLTIINSTVPPRTTMDLYGISNKIRIAYSPIRGVHKGDDYMKWKIKRWTKYVGGATREAGKAAREHFEKLDLKTKVLEGPTEAELAKLFETTYRAWMISCYQEMQRISTHFEADFDDVVDFLEDTHRARLDRPVMFPGEIGGHCLIPSTQLLLESYDSEFLKLILKSNKKRKQEMKNPRTREEAEKIKRRAEKLQQEIMERWTKK